MVALSSSCAEPLQERRADRRIGHRPWILNRGLGKFDTIVTARMPHVVTFVNDKDPRCFPSPMSRPGMFYEADLFVDIEHTRCYSAPGVYRRPWLTDQGSV